MHFSHRCLLCDHPPFSDAFSPWDIFYSLLLKLVSTAHKWTPSKSHDNENLMNVVLPDFIHIYRTCILNCYNASSYSNEVSTERVSNFRWSLDFVEMQFSRWFGEGSGWLDAAQERNGICHNFCILVLKLLKFWFVVHHNQSKHLKSDHRATWVFLANCLMLYYALK